MKHLKPLNNKARILEQAAAEDWRNLGTVFPKDK